MRILIANDLISGHGGAETYIHFLKNILDSHGHTTKLYGHTKKSPFVHLTRYYNPFSYFAFSRCIKKFKPDIIHINNIRDILSPSLLHAAKHYNIPTLATIHDCGLLCPKSYLINDNGVICTDKIGINCIFKKCFPKKRNFMDYLFSILNLSQLYLHRRIFNHNLDAYIVLTNPMAARFKKLFDIPHYTLPNPYPLASVHTPLPNTPSILFVGRLAPEKGVEYLISAFSLVLQKIPHAKLTIVGDGPQKPYLIKLTKKLRLTKNITFTGRIPHSNLKKYYQNAQVVVIPSFWAENQPYVALEAMAYARPVIYSDIFGLGELMKNKKSGLGFKPGDPIDLAKKIITLLSNPRLAKKMSNAAKKEIKEFSPEKHYTKLMKIYTDLIAKHK